MFQSAIVRLTAGYLVILMSISLLFSITVYNVATREVSERLQNFQQQFEEPGFNPFLTPNHRLFSELRNRQYDEAHKNLLLALSLVNIAIFTGGGWLSYLLARRTLRDVELAHESQTRFASDASHELRTPLTVMKTELEFAIQNTKLTKSEMKELLQSNLEEVNKLTSMSQMLLNLAKMDYANLDFKPVDLGITVNEVIQRYDKNANRIKFSPPKKPIAIKANKESIEQLFSILVDNALKYSPAKSTIVTELYTSGKKAVFAISNSGKGIPSDQLPRIFDRFYRVNESRSDGGAGLGLALAKEIVTIHKGDLEVESSDNKTTTFRVLLPLSSKYV